MAKSKFYAVKSGINTGVFDNWAECEANVKGYKNAQYKSFPTLAEAKKYLGVEDSENINKNDKLPDENEVFAYTDGSFNVKTGVYGYGVVLIFHDGTELVFKGSDDKADVASMRNVAGELKGACVAMQYAYRNDYKRITVFHDYEGVSKWADNLWKANLEYTKKYADYVAVMRKKIDVKFSKVPAHSGVWYNEKADILAKEAVGISD